MNFPNSPALNEIYTVGDKSWKWDGVAWSSFKTTTETPTSSALLTSIKTVDGSGSGLDADLLDGYDSTYFQPSSTAITTGNISNQSVLYATSSGGAASVYDTTYTRFTQPNSASYVTTTSSITGAIAITLPVGMTGSMLRFTIKVYEYITNKSFEVSVGGYPYNVGNTWANNPFAYIVGNPTIDRRFNVRFGYTSGGKAVVYIGETNTVWSYPQVFVTDVQVGFSGYNSTWLGAWSIGFVTTFENVTATVSNAQVGFATSNNTTNAVVLRDSNGDFTANNITGNRFTSTVATGTAPLTVASTTVVTNLNADLLDGYNSSDFYLATNPNGYTSNTGTVTSVGLTVPTGLSVSNSPITTNGSIAITLSAGYSIPNLTSQSNWDTAYTDRNKWDGGSTGLVAATGRTSLGATTVGGNLFTLANPNAVTFIRLNADNTVSALDATAFKDAIGATGGGSGTVTSVVVAAGTGIGVSGSPITTSGTITVTNTAPNVTTDISITHNTNTVVVNSSDGLDGTINAATTTSAGVLSSVDKTKLDGIASGAEVNQNAFSSILVSGQSDVVADAKSDSLTLIAGSNITITTNPTADSITINANSYSLDGGFAASVYTATQIIDGGGA